MDRADLVLEGGGVKGIALVGALAALDTAGVRPHRIAGSSAGAVVGALAAAGMPTADLAGEMRRVDYTRFRDESVLDRVPVVGKLASILLERGMYEGKAIVAWLEARLGAAGATTFGDLHLSDDDPGSATRDAGRAYRFVATVSDVTLGRLGLLPWDFHTVYRTISDPGGTDRRSVAEAVRASTAIPYYFEPSTLTYETEGEAGDIQKRESLLVDGGLLSNFPVHVFDRSEGRPRWPTIGIKLSARPEPTPPTLDARPGPVRYLTGLVGAMTGFFDRQHIEDPDVVSRTIFVDTTGFGSVDFDIGREERDVLFERGRKAAEAFLATFDFDAYCRNRT
ncbi:MAG: patatin-like phospholipase family protein [Acidimicrobiia bacterium]|nr:patatin-like phospholipase family protein [Acidimicrobiia bacterium]